MSKPDPVDDVLARFNAALADDNKDAPAMPFPTACVLTPEQELAMVDHCIQRIDDLESETGRDLCGADDWWEHAGSETIDGENTRAPQRTFMGKRKLFELTYENKVDWRKNILGGIYAESNLVVPLARRITRQMVARANNYFFGTDPWFAAYPVGESDAETARKAMKYGQYKSQQAGSRSVHEEANERAFVLGEAVVKSAYSVKETIYKKRLDVMVDGEGRDILDASGEYITEDATWTPAASSEAWMEQHPDEDPGLLMVLKADGVTEMPENPIYESKLVSRRRVHYHAPEQNVVHYRDFLCPLNARSIEDADIAVHLYDIPVDSIIDHWSKRGMVDLTAAQSNEITLKAMAALKDLHSSAGSNPYENGATSARAELGESNDSFQQFSGQYNSQIAECYIRHDVDGDGLMEEIMVVLDIQNRVPIYYDYVANITPDGKRPFNVVRINPVADRWHGIGSMEMFESTQNIVDLLTNRWNFAQTKAARVDFWNAEATLEGQQDPNLELNGGSTYTLAPGKTAEDALQSVYLYENKGNDLRELTEFFLQMAMNESGIQHANDSFVSGMDSSKLATGIRNIEKTGQEMFSLYLSHLEPGHSGVVQKFFDLLMANIREEEVITYFENDNPEELLTIAGSEISNIRLNVSILLTRQRGEEIIESSLRSVDLVDRYYASPPEVRQVTAPLYRDMLRVFNVANVDEIISPDMPIPMVDGSPAMNPDEMASAAAEPVRQSAPNI